jgi:hypothetical protein
VKIDKVIFSTSERFSVFWNLNAKIFKTKLGIEPVCLLFGDRSKTDMTEEHGKIIEVPVIPHLPLLIQITWSKFYWPILEPDTTWLIGDIDLYPLQREWFIDRIAGIPDEHYAHLDADGITQLNGTQYTWANKELNAGNLIDKDHSTNLPGHYHCGKGSTLKTGLEQHGSFEDELRHIVQSGQYNGTRAFRECDPIDQHNLWCAEELRSTRAVRRSILNGRINFTGLHLRHGINRSDGDRLDKSQYDESLGDYVCDKERLYGRQYVDLHCIRPFAHYLDELTCKRRWGATEKVLRAVGMLD